MTTQRGLIERVKQYRSSHECSLVEAKQAIEKEDILKDIEDLEYYEASRSVKEILKKLAEKVYA